MVINHAIVGCGRVAPAHADAFSRIPDVRLYYAMDTRLNRAEQIATKFGINRTSDNYESLLADDTLMSISLTVPHYLHAPMALQAVQAGKHVLVEKPFVLDTSEGRQILEAAAAANVVVMPVAQHRFDPVVKIVYELVRSGDLGKLVLVRGHLECVRRLKYYTDSSWRGSLRREGGSVLINQAYHIVDLLICLAGRFSRVSAEMNALALKGVIETEDTLAASFVFDSGAIGALTVTGAAGREWASFIELLGTAGAITFDIDSPNQVRRLELKNTAKQHAYEALIREASAQNTEPAAALAYYGNSHRNQARAFTYLLQGKNVEGASTGDEALAVVDAIQSVYQSARAQQPLAISIGHLPERKSVDDGSSSLTMISRGNSQPAHNQNKVWRDVQEEDIEAISQLLRNGVLNVVSGGMLEKFEREFAEYTGSAYGVAFCNGTGAIHAALFAVGIRQGDDVLICDYSFHGAAAAVLRLGARIVPVDCLTDSLTMDADDLRRARTPKTKAILVHNPWGVPADYAALRDAAGDLPLISDASHAHGATYLDKPIAHWADITCFSLGQGKLITGGELGIAVTDNLTYRDKMLIYGHVNRVPDDLLGHNWKGNAVGLKLRPHVVAVALARSQLVRYEEKRALTENTCRRIEAALEEVSILPQAQPAGARRVYYKIVSRIDKREYSCSIREVLAALSKAGLPYERNQYWPLLQHHSLLSWPEYHSLILHRDCPSASNVVPDTICLPAPVVVPEVILSNALVAGKNALQSLRRKCP
jgi:predicted dehydrogenase/dTDP-4-amino-4,6-dideoxygalactose transaminase